MNYVRPASLNDALTLLSSDTWGILSGGTDFYPALQGGPIAGNVLDLSQLSELATIHLSDNYWHIGARATWTDVLRADLPPAFAALALAAREDGVPPLLCLDAEVQIASQSGSRVIALREFIVGNRQTLLRADEMVTGLRIPIKSTLGHSHFAKLGARRYLIISIAMVAVRLATDENNRLQDAAISVGSCSVVAQRLYSLEEALLGKPLDHKLATLVDADACSSLSPISDVRATAEYRKQAAVELIRRSLCSLVPA